MKKQTPTTMTTTTQKKSGSFVGNIMQNTIRKTNKYEFIQENDGVARTSVRVLLRQDVRTDGMGQVVLL